MNPGFGLASDLARISENSKTPEGRFENMATLKYERVSVRMQFAAMAMQGLLSAGQCRTMMQIAQLSVTAADNLIMELTK